MNNLSEEEKKAIEEVNNLIENFKSKDNSMTYKKEELWCYLRFKDYKAIDIVLNLIDKQQKEIEEMREELQMYVDIEENFDTVYMKAVADFKDKIREKIKEIENVETDKISREEYNRIEFAIEILLELLEE